MRKGGGIKVETVDDLSTSFFFSGLALFMKFGFSSTSKALQAEIHIGLGKDNLKTHLAGPHRLSGLSRGECGFKNEDLAVCFSSR